VNDERIELLFKVGAQTTPGFAEMLEMVNRERISNGLKNRRSRPEMTEVAWKHIRGYVRARIFSHYTPGKNKSLFDPWMREDRARYTIAGETGARLNLHPHGIDNRPDTAPFVLRPRVRSRVGTASSTAADAELWSAGISQLGNRRGQVIDSTD